MLRASPIPKETFETGIHKTVQWYLDHAAWVENVTTGNYQKWIETNYGQRT
jgi:dTDP-glucose 4,6-dehydratase